MNHMYGGVYIPNLANDAKQYGIGQYRFAHNYELVGKELKILADKEYTVKFTSQDEADICGTTVCWECEKLAAKMYFVRLGEGCAVIDLANGLASLVSPDADAPVSGVIDGFTPEFSHTPCTDDMVGTKVRWVFGANRFVEHDYCAPDKIRTAWARNTVNIGYDMKSFRDFWKPAETDFAEEDANEVFLGTSFYLVDVKAKMPEGIGYCAPSDITRIVMLQDYDHMMTVGCAFGSEQGPIMFAGYGMFLN